MRLIDLFIKNQGMEDLYSLIEKSEKGEVHEREKSIDYLRQANLIYQTLIVKKGKNYCLKRCPDVPQRMNMLVDKLMEYHS
jgi:hypothetical protein